MKLSWIFACVLLTMVSTSRADSFTNFSGQWKGECFDGWNSHLKEISIEQDNAEKFSLTAWETTLEHVLNYLPGETFHEERNVDMDDLLEFKEGVHHWFWCPGSDKKKVCRDSTWATWSEFSVNEKTKWNGNGEMWIDEKGRLIIRELELYELSPGKRELHRKEFCRYEKK